MCGRYYMDDETTREIEKIAGQVSARLSHKRDIYPTNKAPVLYNDHDEITAADMVWGFPDYSGKGVLINARCETVREKKLFRDAMLHRRCVIPAAGFYEWDKEKNKVGFQKADEKTLFMAGLWTSYGEEYRYVIVTTDANEYMRNIHDRMPLLLNTADIEKWIYQDDSVDFLVSSVSEELQQIREYEQTKLPFW